VFAAVPVVVSSGRLVVVQQEQQQELAGVQGVAEQTEAVLTGLQCLKGLRELRLDGQPAALLASDAVL
jgi:hypothetical protein